MPAFHGHGGNGAAFEKKLAIEQLWPDAVVVYADGLVGHQGITDPEGKKAGWQRPRRKRPATATWRSSRSMRPPRRPTVTCASREVPAEVPALVVAFFQRHSLAG